MVVNNTVNEAGDTILIKLIEPYKRVRNVISYTDVTTGEDSNNYFAKWFRWSTDNKTFSDFVPLDDINLSNLSLDSANDFWIEYKYEAEEIDTGHVMEFVSISLEVITESGRLQNVVQVQTAACDPSSPGCIGNLIIEDCCGDDNTFKPYAWMNGVNCLYDQLSDVTTKIFGHCVRYYRVEPDKESDDVILREYSIFNRNKVRDVQVLVPDNDFPANDFQFDPFDGMGFEGFEIHVTRREFEKAFGAKSRPRERDSIYFPINQRMYTVNSVALADEINAMHTYYKIKLRKFEDSQSTIDTPEIENELNDLVVGMGEMFEEKTKEEFLKVTKPLEYKTIGQGDSDYVRSEINTSIVITDENINNNWTIVSKNFYDLSKMKNNTVAVKYRTRAIMEDTEDRAFTFWFRPKFKAEKPRNNVNAFNNNNGNLSITTASAHGLSVGDFIEVIGNTDYENKIHRVISVTNINEFTIDTDFLTSSIVTPFVTKIRPKERATLIYGYNLTNPTNNGLSIDLYQGYSVVTINSNRYTFPLGVQTYDDDTWHAVVVNLSNKFKQLSSHMYKLNKSQTYTVPQNEDSSMTSISYSAIALPNKVSFDSGDMWSLLGSSIDLTNIRIFKTPIEEESQNAVLNQYVVRDTQLVLLIDNAVPRLKLAKFENPR